MSKRAEALTIRRAEPHERDALEELQRRASLALPDHREQLLANPDAIALPPEQVVLGQVLVAEIDGGASGVRGGRDRRARGRARRPVRRA